MPELSLSGEELEGGQHKINLRPPLTPPRRGISGDSDL